MDKAQPARRPISGDIKDATRAAAWREVRFFMVAAVGLLAWAALSALGVI